MAVSEYEYTVINMLLNNLDKWYEGYKGVHVEFFQQAACRYKNGGHGIVDLSVHIYSPKKKNGGNWYNFEIKSGESDLNSGRGLNLYSMYNYLVYPKSLITTLPGILTYDKVDKKLKSIDAEHAGIIGVISDNEFIVERKARRYNGEGMPKDIKPHRYKISGF